MSNILICYYSGAGNTKYQDLADNLFLNGNNVLQWNIRDFMNPATYQIVDVANNISKITEFKPDVIFSYNNCLPKDLFSSLKCPILVIDADNPEMFWNKELLNGDKKNVYYLGYQTQSKKLYKKILNLDIVDKNYLFFPPVSDFKSDPKIPTTINISFIGSNFYADYEYLFANLDTEGKDFFVAVENFKNDYFFNSSLKGNSSDNVKHIIVGQQRIQYLQCLSDLGLEIYSNSNWKKSVSPISLDVASCYKDVIVQTKSENQNLYNSSKISINISHPQAIISFSWRVTDIMASNSCLVMEDKPDWHEVFGKYISQEVKNAIIYSDKYDMRQKCINLLNDEDLRLRCVKECQSAIEKNGRWNHRLKEIEKLIEIKLIQNNLINKSKISNKIYKNQSTIPTIPTIIVKKNKFFIWGLLLTIYLIPFVGKFIIKKKKARKLIYKIASKID